MNFGCQAEVFQIPQHRQYLFVACDYITLPMTPIERIKEKLSQLKKNDPALTIFGATNHRYRLNSPLDLENVRRFEIENQIRLPSEYVQFISTIANGGAGPYYGLEPLQDSLYQDLDYKRPNELLSPSKPFIHSSTWNKKFAPTVDEKNDEVEYQRQYEEFHDEYFDPRYINGVIAICNFGCAVTILLVVNGSEYGYIWTDDRASDYGIHPSHELGNSEKLTFLNWYERWLDNSLRELNVSFKE